MNNAFMKFHDFAVANGLLDSSSELGRQLLATKEKFITIVQAGGEDLDANDGHEGRRRGSTSTTDSVGSDRRRKATTTQPEPQTNPPEYMITRSPEPPQLYPGLTITHEPISQSYLTPSTNPDLSLSIPSTNQAAEFQPTTTAPGTTFSKSFDFTTIDFNFDFLSAPQAQPQPQPHQPQISSPYSSLPAPSSYASHEITFGRRYQRFAVERAHMLVTMPNPPIEKLSKAFSFCLLFESPDMIFQRTLETISRSANESLHNWKYPFYHLGGAGTHLLNSTVIFHPGMKMHLQIGNQGTVDVLKPHPELTAGFGMGPFPPAVCDARDKWLDKETMKMLMPGLDGEFYDCDEVEFYFHQRGVKIPPGADRYTVEIYPAQFGGRPASGSLEDLDLACLDSVVHNCIPGEQGSPPSSMDYMSNTSIISDDFSPYQKPSATTKPLTPGEYSSSLSPPSTTCSAAQDWSSRFLGVPQHTQQANDTSFDFSVSEFGSPARTDNSSNNSMYASPRSHHSSSHSTGSATTTNTSFDQAPPPVLSTSPPQPQQIWNQRMLVTIDVNKLVQELVEGAICLGRTPGIRVEDINAAFWKSVEMSVPL